MLGSDFMRDSIFSEVAIVPNLAFFSKCWRRFMRAQATPELASLSSVSSGEAELPEGTKRSPISGRWFQKKDIFQTYGYVSLPEGRKSSKKGSDNFWLVVLTTNQSKIWFIANYRFIFIGLWVVRQTHIC